MEKDHRLKRWHSALTINRHSESGIICKKSVPPSIQSGNTEGQGGKEEGGMT